MLLSEGVPEDGGRGKLLRVQQRIVSGVAELETDSSYVTMEGSLFRPERGVAVAQKETMLILPESIIVVSSPEAFIASFLHL